MPAPASGETHALRRPYHGLGASIAPSHARLSLALSCSAWPAGIAAVAHRSVMRGA